MSAYNLNDNVKESFEFILSGFTYKMKYPTVEETEKVQEAIKKAEQDEDTKAVLNLMYGFISSDDEKAPDFAEAIRTQNIKVIQNFNDMIKAEFGAE